jgi:hypothetical protein
MKKVAKAAFWTAGAVAFIGLMWDSLSFWAAVIL